MDRGVPLLLEQIHPDLVLADLVHRMSATADMRTQRADLGEIRDRMPCSRLGLSLTSMTMKPWSIGLMSTP
jgi:hypothetical protein